MKCQRGGGNVSKNVGAQHDEPKKSEKCRGSPCGCPVKGTACRAPTI